METPKWIKWYICGEYHCDHCPYSWEERGMEDADAGCFLFGELRDTCRHIRNPISQMIVNKHKNEYDSRWDCWAEYGDILEICERIQQDICRDMDKEYTIGMEYRLVRDYDEYDAIRIIEAISLRYDRYAHPYRSPWQKLKEAFAEWRKDFVWRHFKCYFRRRRG